MNFLVLAGVAIYLLFDKEAPSKIVSPDTGIVDEVLNKPKKSKKK